MATDSKGYYLKFHHKKLFRFPLEGEKKNPKNKEKPPPPTLGKLLVLVILSRYSPGELLLVSPRTQNKRTVIFKFFFCLATFPSLSH